MDIYSLDRTDESTKSPSIQRCIFGEYRRDERKEEEVRVRTGWREGLNFREEVLCQPVMYT
jgi:hypothetical protein